MPRILQSCFALLFLWILAAGSASPAAAQSIPRVLYEQDFVADPALAALSTDIVLFDLEPLSHGQTAGTHLARYDLEAGKHTICLDADDPFLTDVVLEDGRGKKLLRLHRPHHSDGKDNGRRKPRKPECAQVTLAADTYTIRVSHDGGSIAEAHRVAFAQPMSASPRLIDDAGASLGGYWALRPDPTRDPGVIDLANDQVNAARRLGELQMGHAFRRLQASQPCSTTWTRQAAPCSHALGTNT